MITYVLADASGESSGYSYLTLAEIKTYLSEDADASTYDALLTDIYYSCASQLERETAQSLKNRDVTVQYDYNNKYYALPIRPFTSLTSVTYTSTDESSAALYEASGHFDVYGKTSRDGEYVLKFYKDYNKIDIVYNSNGSTVPREFKIATLAMIKKIWNDDRDFTGELSKIKMPAYTLQVINSYKRIVI